MIEKKYSILLIIALIIFSFHGITALHNNSKKSEFILLEFEPQSYILAKNGSIYVNEKTSILIVVYNPTTYLLKNISLSVLFPLETKFYTNTTNVKSNFEKTITEEGFNITIYIEEIPKNFTYFVNFTVTFTKAGKYTIKGFSVKGLMKKGELEKTFETKLNNVVITVEKGQQFTYPKEGRIESTYFILLITILPILILYFSKYIAWKLK